MQPFLCVVPDIPDSEPLTVMPANHRSKTPADLRLFYLQRAPPIIPGVSNVQTYFPSLEQLFPSLQTRPQLNPTLAATELVSQIGEDGIGIVENLITHETRQTPVWMRQVHLVQPLDVADGSFVLPHDGALPAPRAPWQAALRKLNDPYNEAYTDAVCACMMSRLVETKRSPHFCRFYGTVAGRVPEYVYNVTDDLEEIEEEDWFKEGMRTGAFKVVAVDPWDPTITAELTQPWGTGPSQGCVTGAEEDEVSTDESEEEGSHSTPSATSDASDNGDDECDLVEEDDIPITGEATVRGRRIRLNRVSPSTEGDTTTSSSMPSEDDLEYRMLIKDFPVQVSILERCDGTMDQLMEDELANARDMADTKEQRWTAWMFQVIAALTTAQQAYDFIHNDLHTNNVMWTGTGETHLYYHVRGAPGGDRYYRVPTYGRLMKIIDFGRATFRPPAAATNNRLWIPDAYAPGGDAAGQYNCGPYFQQGEPKVQPNKSFDLCRLAVAILDTLWPEMPEAAQPRRVLTRESGRVTAETVSPLWNLLWLWLTDRHGKNLLLDPDGDERYPTFDLYCAIAADAKNAIPATQLTLPIFDDAFRCKRSDIPDDATIWTLHAFSPTKN